MITAMISILVGGGALGLVAFMAWAIYRFGQLHVENNAFKTNEERNARFRSNLVNIRDRFRALRTRLRKDDSSEVSQAGEAAVARKPIPEGFDPDEPTVKIKSGRKHRHSRIR